MALIKCYECGGMVSTKAAACPHCGAPARTAEGHNAIVNQNKRNKHYPLQSKTVTSPKSNNGKYHIVIDGDPGSDFQISSYPLNPNDVFERLNGNLKKLTLQRWGRNEPVIWVQIHLYLGNQLLRSSDRLPVGKNAYAFEFKSWTDYELISRNLEALVEKEREKTERSKYETEEEHKFLGYTSGEWVFCVIYTIIICLLLSCCKECGKNMAM